MLEFQRLMRHIVQFLGRAISIIWLLHPFCDGGAERPAATFPGDVLDVETNAIAACGIIAVPRRMRVLGTRARLQTLSTPMMNEIGNTVPRRITQISCILRVQVSSMSMACKMACDYILDYIAVSPTSIWLQWTSETEIAVAVFI